MPTRWTRLKMYLDQAGYRHGPLFRASINSSGGPLSHDAAHHRWTHYCAAAGVDIDIHQLRPHHDPAPSRRCWWDLEPLRRINMRPANATAHAHRQVESGSP